MQSEGFDETFESRSFPLCSKKRSGMNIYLWAALSVIAALNGPVRCDEYVVDDSFGFGRQFDGIGGLSGGSATSKLLIGYPEKERNEILDYLFLPKFAASLQILKVEIGGDAQASDATEASHMHTPWEENYERGYEWWLMKEAKKRNPNIKLYGLPWDFPGWIGNGTQNPYINPGVLADYIYRWINGAKVHHGLDIDYIGIWNERGNDLTYIKTLRQVLDSKGYTHTRIVGGDVWWSSFVNVYTDTETLSSIDILGSHYPGVVSPEEVMRLGKPLWSSEDYSSYNDATGGGCWARILNQNYVQGLMTSTIAWNLIDSFYEGLPWDRDSLMTAREPWSGNYLVESPIWMSAHTTQMSEPGWFYLPHHRGVGMLAQGGSYVTLVSPTVDQDMQMTIVIETMSHDHSQCIRPPLPPYNVVQQTVTFTLEGSLKQITQLYAWQSILRFNAGETSTYFEQLPPVQVVDGKVTVTVGVDQMLTLSTVQANHGVHPPPPDSTDFPVPFFDNFEQYPLSAEPYILAPQQGSYEVVSVEAPYNNVMRQMVLQPPVAWCPQTLYWNGSLNLLGRINWTDVDISVDVRIGAVNGSNGIFIGVRIDNGGCSTSGAKGIYYHIFPNDNLYLVSTDIQGNKTLTAGRERSAILKGWNKLTLSVKDNKATGTCNGVQLFDVAVPSDSPPIGFVGVGTDVYGIADFDNLRVSNGTTGNINNDDNDNEIKTGKNIKNDNVFNDRSINIDRQSKMDNGDSSLLQYLVKQKNNVAIDNTLHIKSEIDVAEESD